VTTEELGRVFLDRLTLPFEAISLLIVVSIIGAIMLALFSKGDKQGK
jgi:NADH:ubiquinone oxidoreductase subunit 6 (subunit J)